MLDANPVRIAICPITFHFRVSRSISVFSVLDQSDIFIWLLVLLHRDVRLGVVHHLLRDLVMILPVIIHREFSYPEKTPLFKKVRKIQLAHVAADLQELDLISNGIIPAAGIRPESHLLHHVGVEVGLAVT